MSSESDPTNPPNPDFNLAIEVSPRKLSPWSYLSLVEWYVHFNVTATLVTLDGENQVRSGLAEIWRVMDDGRTYVFSLRKKIQWSNGTEIKPAEILRSVFLESKHKNAALLHRIIANPVHKNAYISGENEITVKLAESNSTFLMHLARPEFGVVHLPSFTNKESFTSEVPTSGPYKFLQISDSSIDLVPNEFSADLKSGNPKRVRFNRLTNQDNLEDEIESGKISFLEVQSDAVLEAARVSGKYREILGAMDNLATIQARKISEKQRSALFYLRWLIRNQSNQLFGSTMPVSLVSNSSVSNKELSQLISNQIPPRPEHSISLKVMTSPLLTKNQVSDLEKIKGLARSANIFISEEKVDAETYRSRWEGENYELALTRMGVYAYDEVELIHGYFCTGFSPYVSFKELVCRSIVAATRPGLKSDDIGKLLAESYAKIFSSGKIIPLYHFPRRFLVHKTWTTERFNILSPFPRFRSFVRLIE